MKIKVDVSRLPKAPYSRPNLPEAKAPDRPYENMNWDHKPVTTDSKQKEAYTPDVDAKIIQWHKEGKSFGYMAERLGRSPGGVKAIARAECKDALSGRETPLNEAIKTMQETVDRFEKILEEIPK